MGSPRRENELRQSEIDLASVLHDLRCSYSHADQCGWYYEKEYTTERTTKKRYLDMARRLLESPEVKDIGVLELVEILRIVKSL